MPSQHGERVRLEWGADGLEALGPAADIIVVIDVLSFSTCVEIATSRGAVVYPYLLRDESARSFAADRGAALAGRRGEAEYSLSPASLAELDAGQRLVLPSPNGSTIALAAKRHGHVLAGSLRNARAVAAACRALGGTVAIIAAGERWPTGGLRPAIEDALGAGAIASYLEPASCSPEARAAAAAFLGVRDDLRSVLLECTSGRELCAIGYDEDVEIAATLDISENVPRLENDAFVRGTSCA